MTKDVLISIKGLQFEASDQRNQAIEVISPGEYYYRNGKHFVLFEEVMEGENGGGEITKCTLKAWENQIELIKKGVVNTHMVFGLGHKNITYYNTPFGQLLIGLDTGKIVITEKEKEIGIFLEYGMELNQGFVADCNIEITITGK